jgi:hypothetical protein
MPPFFRNSTVWVLDFTYKGAPRRWFKAFPEGVDPRAGFEALIADLHGPRGQVVGVRVATAEEETQYLRGDLPRNAMCPTGRGNPGNRED